jgi:putative two-component system response regulator
VLVYATRDGLTLTTAPTVPPRQTVLIVDDSESARATLLAFLSSEDLHLPVARQGEEGIEEAIRLQPDLILLDVMMPKMDGYEVCLELRRNPKTAMIPIVMVTALDDREARLRGIEAGADDFLTKPVDRLELQARVRTTLRLNRYRRQLDQRKQVVQTMEGSMAVMQDILCLVDPDAFGRSKQLQARVAKLGEALKYPDIHQLRLAAALCKIGRVVIPEEVREKVRGGERLTVAESRMLERVPEVSHRLLAHMPSFSSVAKDVLWQDKRFDGTGFPFETRVGSAIPLGARIIHLVQDLLEHEAAGLGRAAAIAVCEEDVGHYDPELLEAAKLVFLRDTRVERILKLSELEAGMVTRSNIKDGAGRTLVAANIIITDVLLQRLNYFHETRGLQQPFEVTEESTD